MTRRALTTLSLSACLALGLTADASALPQLKLLHPQVSLKHPAGLVKAGHKKKKAKKKKASGPTISSITPMSAKVGEKLTVTGKGFVADKTRVYFLRIGGGVVIAKPDTTGSTRLVVTIPDTVTPLLRAAGAPAAPTRFQVRILAKKFGKATPKDHSPVIGPADGVPSGNGSGGTGGAPTCNPSDFPNGTASDTDGDLLSNTVEANTTHTDPCSPDTDGDGITDGYEYQSALDMNNTTPFGVADAALPYPGKKPWPNPLDPTDAKTDHDGDGLTMTDEFQLWTYYGAHSFPLNYSDGKQASVNVAASGDPTLDYIDMNGNGILTDDERDADNDGLGNWDEKYGRMTQTWWDKEMNGQGGKPKETRYPVAFPEVSMVDPDSDGDGVLDGADDQDHDGLTNAFEISRPWDWQYTYVSGHWAPFIHNGPADEDYQDADPPGPIPVGVGPNFYARVQPYNPCKPLWSKTCHLHPPFGYYGDQEDWPSPDPTYAGPIPPAPWLADPNDYHTSGGE
jgi:hypothetical protein